MIFIDFETRSEVELIKCGAWKYAEDESTDVLCMGFALSKTETFLWLPGHEVPEVFKTPDQVFVAHNAFFERSIYENVMVKKYGFPPIRPDQWSCSAAKAAAHALPRSLANAASAMGLAEQKDTEGKKIMLKLCKPRTPTKLNPDKWHNSTVDFLKLYDYCVQDLITEIELNAKLPDLMPFEKRVWVLDQNINARGICVDLETVDAALKFVEKYQAKLTKELHHITNYKIQTAGQRDKMLDWIFSQEGLELETLQKRDVKDLLDRPDLSPDVRRVLEIRQELSKTSVAKFQALKDCTCADGRIRDLLMYHGASTGRWSGKSFQPQNIRRNDLIKDVDQAISILKQGSVEAFTLAYEKPMDALSCLLRPMLIASPGKKLIGGDYAAIEARVLFWLAGETQGLQMFRDGIDLYVDLAKVIYRKDDINKMERDLGKRGILGAGYGMGKTKFKLTCDAGGLQITEELAETAIEAYRNKYQSVVKFWYGIESDAIQAVKTGLLIKQKKLGYIQWKTHGRFLYCRLPSGRCLAYYNPKIELVDTPWGEKKEALTFWSVNSTTKKWEKQSTYGGALTENVTQATARDLMAHAMVRAEDTGLQVLLSVHDELITESSTHSAADLKLIMETLPDWAAGFPIKAETWSGDRYAK